MGTEENKNNRVVQIEIDDEVRKLTIEGVDKDAQVVMRQELSDDELDNVAGGGINFKDSSWLFGGTPNINPTNIPNTTPNPVPVPTPAPY